MFALYPLLASALQRFAKPDRSVIVASLALAGTFIALALGAFQVFVQGYSRAQGYASNPIPSATVALFLGFFALLGLFSVKTAWRYVFLLGPIAGLATVLLAQSRGPLIALPALVIIALVMVPIRRVFTVGAVVVLVLAAGALAVVKPSVFGRIESLPAIIEDLATGQPIPYSVDGSGNIRYRILMGSLGAFKDSPWLGYGWYMKIPVVEKYIKDPVGFGDPRVAHLHSDILNLGVSAGIVGLFAYVLVLLAPVVSAATSPRDMQFRGRLFLAISLSAGFLCCGAVNLLFGFEFMTTLYVVFAAIFIGYCRDAPALAAA
jgi:O-antigen ligase